MRAAVAIVLLVPSAAAANPADMFGFGARGAGMGGAQVAVADDSSATYYNPARLAGGDDIRIDVGYQLAMPTLEVDGNDTNVDWSRGMTIGLLVPGRVAGRRIAIGAGIGLPDQHLTRTRSLPSPRPRFAYYDNRPQRLFLSADAAFELVPGLTIGGGLAYLSSTQGTVNLRGLIGFPQTEQSDLELAIDVDLETIRYPHLGIAWAPTPWLDFGLSYRGGFVLELDLAFRIDGDVGLPDQEPVVDDGFLALTTASQDLFQPAQLTAGMAVQVTPRLTTAFDLAYHRWSTFDNPAARLQIELDVGQFQDLVDLPGELALPRPHYHDTIVPRLGVEHLAWTRGDGKTVHVRGGYVYEPSPVPEQFGATNFIDNDRHIFSTGVGLQWPHLGALIPRPFGLDAFVALTVLDGRDHAKLSPVDPVGDYRSDGWVLAAGMTSRWRF